MRLGCYGRTQGKVGGVPELPYNKAQACVVELLLYCPMTARVMYLSPPHSRYPNRGQGICRLLSPPCSRNPGQQGSCSHPPQRQHPMQNARAPWMILWENGTEKLRRGGANGICRRWGGRPVCIARGAADLRNRPTFQSHANTRSRTFRANWSQYAWICPCIFVMTGRASCKIVRNGKQGNQPPSRGCYLAPYTFCPPSRGQHAGYRGLDS